MKPKVILSWLTLQHGNSTDRKWNFPLRISSVNLTKSAGNCRFGHIYCRNPSWNISFFVQCRCLFHNIWHSWRCLLETFLRKGTCWLSKLMFPVYKLSIKRNYIWKMVEFKIKAVAGTSHHQKLHALSNQDFGLSRI